MIPVKSGMMWANVNNYFYGKRFNPSRGGGGANTAPNEGKWFQRKKIYRQYLFFCIDF